MNREYMNQYFAAFQTHTQFAERGNLTVLENHENDHSRLQSAKFEIKSFLTLEETSILVH